MPRAPAFALPILALLLGWLPPAAGVAQEAIPTARAAAGVAPAPPSSDPLRLSDHLDYGPDVLRPSGPCGGPARAEDGKPDKSPHGAVWAGVGTRGYREIGGAVCVPVGENAAVSLMIDTGHEDGWRRRR